MSVSGENEMGLRKVIDLTRFASIFILLLHFYFYCYTAFKEWELANTITDRLLSNTVRSGLFDHFHTSKLIALGLLIVSLLGVRGRKNEKLQPKTIVAYLSVGLILFFSSYFAFRIDDAVQTLAVSYIGITAIGFLLILAGGSQLSRLIQVRLSKDVFNSLNETFRNRKGRLKMPIPSTCLPGTI